MIVIAIIVVSVIVTLIFKNFWIVFAVLAVCIALGIVFGIADWISGNGQNSEQNKNQTPPQSKKQDEPTTYEMDHLLSSVDEMLTFDLLNEQQKKLQRLQNNKKRDYTEYWETHCESCDELLEDCECDWERQSKQDVSQSDSGFGTHGGNDFEK